jgi:hypothetical protein
VINGVGPTVREGGKRTIIFFGFVKFVKFVVS